MNTAEYYRQKNVTWVIIMLVLTICVLTVAYIIEKTKDCPTQITYVKPHITYIEPQIPHSIMLQLIHRHGCAIYLGKVICPKYYLLPRLYRV